MFNLMKNRVPFTFTYKDLAFDETHEFDEKLYEAYGLSRKELYEKIEMLVAAWWKENPDLSPNDAVIIWDTRSIGICKVYVQERE